MPAVPVSKPRRDPAATRRQWADRLERFRRSGQTVAQFCAAEGVSEPSFYVWKRTLAATPPAVAPAVVPIHVTPSPPAGALEVALPTGTVVRFPVDTAPAVIAAVVHALEGRPC